MSFDFSLVSAPFRMQPGLRRVAPGRGAADAERARTAATCARRSRCSPASPTRRCCAVAGFDVAPVAARDRRTRRRDQRRAPSSSTRAPPACAVARRGSAGRSSTAGRTATAIRRSARCSRPARAARRRAPCSASPSRKTSPSSTAPTATVPVARGLPAVALGARGQGRPPLRRGARAGRRQRAPARGRANRWPAWSPAASAGSASSGRSPPTRACTSIRRAARRGWPAEADADALAARAFFRSERQTFIPIAGRGAGGVHDPRRQRSARRRGARAPTTRARLHAALASMSPGGARLPRPRRRARPPARLARSRRAPTAAAAHEDRADRRRPRIVRDADGTPRSAEYGDVYHPRAGALAQARHVFLDGDALPARWRGRERFVVLETGFGLGNNFLATWAAWRDDPAALPRSCTSSRSRRAADAAPTSRRAARDPRWRRSRPSSREHWPPLTCNLHRIALRGRPRRAAARASATSRPGCRSWSPRVDAFFLDGFAPARNPAMWDARLFKAMARLAAPDATVATWTRGARGARRPAQRRLRGRERARQRRQARHHARPLRAALHAAGRAAAAVGPWRERRRRTRVASAASVAGRDRRRRPGRLRAGAARSPSAAARRSCSSAARRSPREGSGNAGRPLPRRRPSRRRPARALPSRRCLRRAARRSRAAIDRHGVRGSVAGLLRLETRRDAGRAAGAARRARRCPPTTCAPLDADDASALAGVAVSSPGLALPGGGWVDPRGLARAWLDARRRSAASCASAARSRRCARVDDRWRAAATRPATTHRDRGDASSSATPAARSTCSAGHAWPIEPPARPDQRRRRARRWRRPTAPRLPIAGAGYVAARDRRHGLVRRQRRTGTTTIRRCARERPPRQPRPPRRACVGRPPTPTLDRAVGPGRLALGEPRSPAAHRRGAAARRRAPDWASSAAQLAALDQPRFVRAGAGPLRVRALGSRGIASAALGAQVLAAAIAGAPTPVEADLLDAVDPARFAEPRLPARRGGAPGRRGERRSAAGRAHRRVGRRLSGLGRSVGAPLRRRRRSPSLRPAFSFSFSSFFFFFASSRWRFSNE